MYSRGHGKRGMKREKRRPKKTVDKADQLRREAEEQQGETLRQTFRDAVPADWLKLRHWRGYVQLPDFYFDREFECRDCGKHQVWTAAQQKWYFEVAKGQAYARAVRCRECRRKQRQRPPGAGNPNPIVHPAGLLKWVRQRLAPDLETAGFKLRGRGRSHRERSWWFDYERGGAILAFSIRCPYGPLIVEYMNSVGECRVVAKLTNWWVRRVNKTPEAMEEFLEEVREFLRGLGSDGKES